MTYFDITPSNYKKYKMSWPILKGMPIELVVPLFEKGFSCYQICILKEGEQIPIDYCQTRVYFLCDNDGIILNTPKLG